MIEAQLAKQKSQLQQLMALLEQERSVLKLQDINTLEHLLQDKQLLLQHIADLDQEIAQNTQELAKIKAGGSLEPMRLEIKALLEECKQSNEINGKAIALSLESNHRFAQLLNNVLNRNNITYDQHGKTQSAPRLGKGFSA